MGVGLAAFVWGLAEATVFFIVPDVLLSFVALRSLRRAFTCCLLALAGALLGGVGMYWLGQQWPEAMTRLLDRIPAIAPPMLARVARELADSGALAILLGPLSGTPYKAYAVQAGAAGMGLGAFVLISIPARLGRFLLVCLLSAGIGRLLQAHTELRQRQEILAGVWIVFYTLYFSCNQGN